MAVIYLDNNATTKPFPEVVETMTQFMTSRYWNASSAFGQLDGLEEVVASAKTAIRTLIEARPEDEVVFTSGATESNAWAIAEGARRSAKSGYILTSEIEHPSVAEAFESLQVQGLEVRWVPVTKDGTFDLEKLERHVNSDLRFASLMLAHNETGVIQPLREAAALIRKCAPNCLIQTDATQAIGKISVSFAGEFEEVDLLSFSGHKFHGPKGIGGLVVRNGTNINPFFLGGGQQNSLRSGTLNMSAIAGVSVAATLSSRFLSSGGNPSVRAVRDYFEDRIAKIFQNAYFLGAQSKRLPNTSFFGIPGTDAEDLVNALATEGIALSKGSSCSAQSINPSKAALSMGCGFDLANSLIRISISSYTTRAEIDEFVKILLNHSVI